MIRVHSTLAVVLLLAQSAYADEYYLITASPSAAQARAQAATACAQPSSPACQSALQVLASHAADNLHTLASTRSRQYRALVVEYAALPFASVRAAAANALGAFGPEASETALLSGLLNDPVPLVRRNAYSALQASGDENARRLAHRVTRSSGDGLEPQVAPDAAGLGTPVYPGATYLFYASEPSQGLYAFATVDPTSAAESFFAAKAGKALSRDELKTLLQQQPNQSQMMGAGMAMAKRYQELLKEGKSPQEVSKILASEQQTSMGNRSSPVLGATADGAIFVEPRYYVLAKAQATGLPVRIAAVYQDKALGRTGILLSVPPPIP
jgi:HEAT repeat protein